MRLFNPKSADECAGSFPTSFVTMIMILLRLHAGCGGRAESNVRNFDASRTGDVYGGT